MIVINSSTRQFSIPGADLVFGVESDSGSEVKNFQCPRYVGNNLDIAGSFVRINYRNANGEIDSYLVKNVTVDGDNVQFSWELSPKVTTYKGQIRFVMCVVGPDTKVKWHTTLGMGQVLEGLEPESAMIEEGTADIVAALITMVEAQTTAVENTGAEWVRNVQNEGTDQVIAVQTAAKTAETASVAEIEAKGVNTRNSIPADYTATVNAVQSAANAIRGNVSGGAIRVDDVSPMEHYPVVSVKSKNLFNADAWMNTQYEMNGITITREADKITINGTASGSFSCPVLRLLEPITMGRTYTCTVFRVSGSGNDIVAAIGEGTSQGVRDKFYDCISRENAESNSLSFVASYPYWTSLQLYFNDGVSFSDLVIAIQFEEDEIATNYTPYIDPTTVTIKRYGKNTLGGYTTKTVNGVTFTVHDNGVVSVQGTATADAGLNTKYKLGPGVYTVSGDLANSVLLDGDMYVWASVSNGIVARSYTGSKMRTFTLPSESYVDVFLRVKAERVCNGEVFCPQIEAGDIVTDFVPYQSPTNFTPTADGDVGGLPSLAPTMTLLADTAGVNIECEYSRDTNAVIAEILEKITALGG